MSSPSSKVSALELEFKILAQDSSVERCGEKREL
jgi:hypothetical protein